jgi:hypothetical protein
MIAAGTSGKKRANLSQPRRLAGRRDCGRGGERKEEEERMVLSKLG